MDNKLFLDQMKLSYNSLTYFDYINGQLILKLDKTYILPLNHTNLSRIENFKLYLLSPQEIFQILYMREMIYLPKVSEANVSFAKEYTKKYLELYDEISSNQSMDNDRFEAISIPIHLAYIDELSNNPASKIIIDDINSFMIKSEHESSRGNNKVLVLAKGDNPNFEMEYEEDFMNNLKEAGFATIILITTAVVATCLYIAFYVMSN